MEKWNITLYTTSRTWYESRICKNFHRKRNTLFSFDVPLHRILKTITNKSEYYQHGDTSVMIQTKTTESYDATKKL